MLDTNKRIEEQQEPAGDSVLTYAYTNGKAERAPSTENASGTILTALLNAL